MGEAGRGQTGHDCARPWPEGSWTRQVGPRWAPTVAELHVGSIWGRCADLGVTLSEVMDKWCVKCDWVEGFVRPPRWPAMRCRGLCVALADAPRLQCRWMCEAMPVRPQRSIVTPRASGPVWPWTLWITRPDSGEITALCLWSRRRSPG